MKKYFKLSFSFSKKISWLINHKVLIALTIFFSIGLLISYLGLNRFQVLATSDTFVVEVMNPDATWQQIAAPSFQVNYTTSIHDVQLNNNLYTIRISNQSNSFGDIEVVALHACGNNQPIQSAITLQSHKNVLDDISQDDLNVLALDHEGVQLTWNIPDGCTQGELEIKANKYSTDPSKFMSFPSGNASIVTYEYRNDLSVYIDGILTEVNGVVPQWAPLWISSTGHPVGTTYIYAHDDSNYVYISADITPDNTNEYGTDWFQITVRNSKDKNIFKSYRVSDEDATYGRCSFGITSMVLYRHQMCEIRIPKSELIGTKMQFSLQYYGTMSSNPPVFELSEPETPNPEDEISEFAIKGLVHTVNGGNNETIYNVTLIVYDISQDWLELTGNCTADDGDFDQYDEYFTCQLPTLTSQSILSTTSGYLYELRASSFINNGNNIYYTSLPIYHFFTLSDTPESMSILPADLLTLVGNVLDTETELFLEVLPNYFIQSVKMSIYNNDTDLFVYEDLECTPADEIFDQTAEEYSCQLGDTLLEGDYTVFVNAFSQEYNGIPVTLLDRRIQLTVGTPITPTPTFVPTPTNTPTLIPTKKPTKTYSVVENQESVTPTPTISQTITITPTITVTTKQGLIAVEVVDQNGNLLTNTTVYIDGQQYVTDEKGKIYLEYKPTTKMAIEVQVNGKKVVAGVLGEKIVAELSYLDITNPMSWFWWVLLLVTIILCGFWYFKRGLSKNNKTI